MNPIVKSIQLIRFSVVCLGSDERIDISVTDVIALFI